MAPKKAKEDVAIAAAPPASDGTVSMGEFLDTRDRVVHGLSHLQVAVSNLLTAYLEHCKSISGDDGSSVRPANLNIAGLSFGVDAVASLIDPTDAKNKKKKIKKARDPNAPKRPLTAAFLFGQSARQIVKHDLEAGLPPGEKLGPNAVNEEVTRRWNALDEGSKEAWKEEYRKNLALYREKAAEYERTKVNVDADAEGEAEDAVAGAALAADSDAEGSSDDGSAKEPTPPPKQPTPPPAKGAKRRKTGKENGATPVSEVPLPGAASSSRNSIVPLPGAAAPTPAAEKAAPPKKAATGKKAAAAKADSPDAPKKRAPPKKATKEDAAPEPVAEEPAEKKTSKRKRKGEA